MEVDDVASPPLVAASSSTAVAAQCTTSTASGAVERSADAGAAASSAAAASADSGSGELDRLRSLEEAARAAGLPVHARVPFELVADDGPSSNGSGVAAGSDDGGGAVSTLSPPFDEWVCTLQVVDGGRTEFQTMVRERAESHGFPVRVMQNRPSCVKFVCRCANHSVGPRPAEEAAKPRKTREDRVMCGCLYKLVFRREKAGPEAPYMLKLDPEKSCLTHNHGQVERRMTAAHLSEAARKSIIELWEITVPVQLAAYITRVHQVACTARMVSAVIASRWRGNSKELWGMAEELQRLKASVRTSVDEQGHLLVLSWTFESCQTLCTRFGHVLVLDATYAVNAYGMPLFVYCGSDSTRKTAIFAFSLVCGESSEICRIAFEQYLSLVNVRPTVVITDAAAAYVRPIAEVFGAPMHFWCLWHVVQNIEKHVKNKSGELIAYVVRLTRELDRWTADRIVECIRAEFADVEYVQGYLLDNVRFLCPALQAPKCDAETIKRLGCRGGEVSSQRSESSNAALKQKHLRSMRNAPAGQMVVRTFELATKGRDQLRAMSAVAARVERSPLDKMSPRLRALHLLVNDKVFGRLDVLDVLQIVVVREPDVRVTCRHVAEVLFARGQSPATSDAGGLVTSQCSTLCNLAAPLSACCSMLDHGTGGSQPACAAGTSGDGGSGRGVTSTECTNRAHLHFAAWHKQGEYSHTYRHDVDRVHFVVFDTRTRRIMCSCWRLILDGFPCAHIAAVLRCELHNQDVDVQWLVHERWRLPANVRRATVSSTNDSVVTGTSMPESVLRAEGTEALRNLMHTYARVATHAPPAVLERFVAAVNVAQHGLITGLRPLVASGGSDLQAAVAVDQLDADPNIDRLLRSKLTGRADKHQRRYGRNKRGSKRRAVAGRRDDDADDVADAVATPAPSTSEFRTESHAATPGGSAGASSQTRGTPSPDIDNNPSTPDTTDSDDGSPEVSSARAPPMRAS